MKVILLSDIHRLGKKFDVKEVRHGHALNLLIPKGLVKVATPTSVKWAETEKKRLDDTRKVSEDILLKNLKALEGARVELTLPANEKGHLFSQIHKEKIAEELQKQVRITVPAEYITIAKPIKEIGEHTIKVLIQKAETTFVLNVKPE